MKNLAMAAFLLAVFAMAGQSAVAGSMSGSMASMPKCGTGDQVVGVNTKTKMYMTKRQMDTKMASESPAQQRSMIMKNHVKLMCKSNADSMGARMMDPEHPVSNAGH